MEIKGKKVIVAGSRTFRDYKFLAQTLDKLLPEIGDIGQIVSGMAKGADSMGEYYARDHGIPVKRFPAKWYIDGRYNPGAGYKRNTEMAEYADVLIAFNMGTRGTEHMIKEMRRLDKQVYVLAVG